MYRRTLFFSALLAGSAVFTGAAAAADIDAAPPLFDWSGFYIGAHVGGLFGDDRDGDCDAFKDIKGEEKKIVEVVTSVMMEPAPSDGVCFDAKPKYGPSEGKTLRAFELDGDYIGITDEGGDDHDLRLMFGPQVGINQQYGMWVVGLEADFSWLAGDGDGQDIGFEYHHSRHDNGVIELKNYEGVGRVEGGELDWIATFRGRLGAAVGEEGRGLIYATGGLALAGIEGLSGSFDDAYGSSRDWCDPGCGFDDDTDDDIRVGFAVGAGGEWAWTETVSIGAEYLFLGFGDDGDSLTFHGDDGRQFSFENELDDLHAFRVKLNWRLPPG